MRRDKLKTNTEPTYTRVHRIDIRFRKLTDLHYKTRQTEKNNKHIFDDNNNNKIDIWFRIPTDMHDMTGLSKKISNPYSKTPTESIFHFEN